MVLTFASLYNEPTQWARSLRGGLRHAPEGGGARSSSKQTRAPVVMRRGTGRSLRQQRAAGGPVTAPASDPSAWEQWGSIGSALPVGPSQGAAGPGGGADGTSIPLVSLNPGPAGLRAPPDPTLKRAEDPMTVTGSEDVAFDVAAAVVLGSVAARPTRWRTFFTHCERAE